MRYQGTIQVWKDDKGFGFIRSAEKDNDIFLHISAMPGGIRRPVVGDVVEFAVVTGPDGRSRASSARFVTAGDNIPVRVSGEASWGSPVPYLLLLFCVAASGYFMTKTGYPVFLLYPAMGAVTYATYAQDKALAQEKAFRISESRLHLLELLGGWGGAYLAQERLRHKTVKSSYQSVFWLIVGAHCFGWACWLFTALTENKSWAG